MNNKHISKTIACAFVAATFMISSFMILDANRASAFFGFNPFGTSGEEQEPTSTSTTSQDSSSLQNARCHSPTENVIDSCNSRDLSNTEGNGYNTLG